MSVSIDPFTDWRQIILSSSHLAAAHPAAAEIRSPSAMRKDGVCERAAEVSVCVCESQSGCSMWHYSARLSDRIRHLGGRFGRNLPGPSARQEMGPPCLMPWQPDRKKHKGPTLGASYCICVWWDTYIYIFKYIPCNGTYRHRWERGERERERERGGEEREREREREEREERGEREREREGEREERERGKRREEREREREREREMGKELNERITWVT